MSSAVETLRQKRVTPDFCLGLLLNISNIKEEKSNEACLFLTLLHRSKLQPSEQGEVYNDLQQLDTNQKRKNKNKLNHLKSIEGKKIGIPIDKTTENAT